MPNAMPPNGPPLYGEKHSVIADDRVPDLQSVDLVLWCYRMPHRKHTQRVNRLADA